jgi:hypothetical protein
MNPILSNKHVKDLKAHIDSTTVVVGDFINPAITNRRSWKKIINEETLELNDTINQMNLSDVYTIFHSTTAQYTFFSAAHGTFSKIDNILLHNNHNKIEITPCILSITVH